MRIFAQHTIKTMAANWRQNFASVMFAYRCNPVGIQNSALEKIQSPKKLDAMECEEPLRQICERKIESPETSLISDVMNGQHCFEWQPLCVHKNRHQRRGPIVHVQNFQLRRQPPR